MGARSAATVVAAPRTRKAKRIVPESRRQTWKRQESFYRESKRTSVSREAPRSLALRRLCDQGKKNGVKCVFERRGAGAEGRGRAAV